MLAALITITDFFKNINGSFNNNNNYLYTFVLPRYSLSLVSFKSLKEVSLVSLKKYKINFLNVGMKMKNAF